MIVQPETVLRWRRQGWSVFWRYRWRRWRGGRPRIPSELRLLIRRMARENFLWGAPRIHGELLMLGFRVSQATVSRYMPAPYRRRGKSWRTFLPNQLQGVVLSRHTDSADLESPMFAQPAVTGWRVTGDYRLSGEQMGRTGVCRRRSPSSRAAQGPRQHEAQASPALLDLARNPSIRGPGLSLTKGTDKRAQPLSFQQSARRNPQAEARASPGTISCSQIRFHREQVLRRDKGSDVKRRARFIRRKRAGEL